MRIHVVVPTFNEAANLPRLFAALAALPLDLAVWIVDDESPDDTAGRAETLGSSLSMPVHVVRRPERRGLRAAYLDGIARALGESPDAIGQMDADLSHDPAALLPMTAALAAGADLAIGSRNVAGGSVDPRWATYRKRLSAFGNAYARAILGVPLRDLTSGYRLWRRTALARIPRERIRSNGYVFLVEMAYLAHLKGCRMAEVPIHFAERQEGVSKMSVRIQVEAAFGTWAIRWRYRDLRRRDDRR